MFLGSIDEWASEIRVEVSSRNPICDSATNARRSYISDFFLAYRHVCGRLTDRLQKRRQCLLCVYCVQCATV